MKCLCVKGCANYIKLTSNQYSNNNTTANYREELLNNLKLMENGKHHKMENYTNPKPVLKYKQYEHRDIGRPFETWP
jgi:hypothetical protein